MPKVRVLIIEDDDNLRKQLRLLLDRWHCHVDEAANLQAAEQLWSANHYDIVTLDMRLGPEEEQFEAGAATGWSLLDEWRRSPQPGTAIYVISGSIEGQD